MAFAPLAAALAGFRLVRARPQAVLVWAGVIFVGRLAGLKLTTAISGPFMPALDAAVNATPLNLQAVTVAYQQVAPGYLAGAALALPFFAVVFAAIYRAYLKPEDSRAFFLRLGAQEAAILALILALNLMVLVGLSFGAAVVALLASMIATVDAAAGSLAEAVGLGALLAFVLWGVVRLSLAWPVSFRAARPVLLRSWGLTRGHGWKLLSAYVIAEALMLVVGVLVLGICASLSGAMLVAIGRPLDQLPDALRPAMAVVEVFRPAPLLFSAFEALLLALSATTLVGVAVSALRSFAPQESL